VQSLTRPAEMQLLGDGYEISEMTKLHGLLRPSRFAASVLGHRWSVAGTSVGVFNVNAQIATQANPHGRHAGWPAWAGAHVRLAGWRAHAACGLAHMCGAAVPAMVNARCRFDA
jgi:hypothetical protein